MGNNTKLLVICSLLLVILGFSLLWFTFPAKDTSQTSSVTQNAQPEVSQPPPTSSSSAVFGSERKKVLVISVIDGDTIEINSGIRVRLIGIDTPETKHPKKPVECFGKEASSETKRILEKKEVILQKDVSESDKYQRLLRYVFLPIEDGKLLFVNDYLIREGFARTLTYPPDVKYNEQFLKAQSEAKVNNRGLWGKCL